MASWDEVRGDWSVSVELRWSSAALAAAGELSSLQLERGWRMQLQVWNEMMLQGRGFNTKVFRDKNWDGRENEIVEVEKVS